MDSGGGESRVVSNPSIIVKDVHAGSFASPRPGEEDWTGRLSQTASQMSQMLELKSHLFYQLK